MVLLLGHSEDGRGQWEREGSSAGLWNECVPEKTTCGAKAVCLCMIQPFIISVFQNLGSGCFFRSPAFFSESGGKICRIEVRHFFPPKGGSRYIIQLTFIGINIIQIAISGHSSSLFRSKCSNECSWNPNHPLDRPGLPMIGAGTVVQSDGSKQERVVVT